MAKKKSSSKKHKFKHAVAPSEGSLTVSANPASPQKVTAARPATIQANSSSVGVMRDFSYVLVDLRRIGIMAVSLVLLELVLYYLLLHTSLGQAVYSLLKI